MGQIFSPYSIPLRKVGSKSIPPQIQKLLGHPSQIISKFSTHFFRPKVACSDVTKSTISQKFPTDLKKKYMDDVKLLYEKVCQVSRR